MRDQLDKLPPKMILISSNKPEEQVNFSNDGLDTRVDDVVARILNSKFTSGSDRDKVPRMYKAYVARIAEMLQTTLSFATADAASS